MPAQSAGLRFPLGLLGPRRRVPSLPGVGRWPGTQWAKQVRDPRLSLQQPRLLTCAPEPSDRTEPRSGPPSRHLWGRGAVTARTRGEGRKERQRRAPAPPPCAAYHVSVRGAARTRAPHGEMVRCPRLRPNPAAPRLDLWKVRVHVQRLRGGGGGGRGLGDQLPRLEGPTPGGLSRRARFRYWWGPAGSWSSVHAAPPLRPAWVQLLWDWSPVFCKELGGREKPGVEE